MIINNHITIGTTDDKAAKKAGDQSVKELVGTLYTPPLSALEFKCNTVNISTKV